MTFDSCPVIYCLVAALIAYLIGSIPFAVVISHLMGLSDPRSYGSGNPGATNVLRSGNKIAAGLTLLGDAAKGLVAVLLARHFSDQAIVLALVCVAVFLGHAFSIFLGFKGGKGVATALGVLLGVAPVLMVATALTWLIVARVSRYSSLAALVAAIAAPLYYLLGGAMLWVLEMPVFVALAVITLVLFYRHKTNIGRLLTGTESRIGDKKKAS